MFKWRHRSRCISRDSDWTSKTVLNRFEHGRNDRAEEGCRNSYFSTSLWVLFHIFHPVLCGTHHTFYNELRVDFFVHAVRLCSAMSVSGHMSNCGQTPAVPEPERRILSGAEDESRLRVCDRCLHVPVGGEHVLSSCDCRDDTEHRGNPNCARADDLAGNSRGSGSGKNAHPSRGSEPVVKSVM